MQKIKFIVSLIGTIIMIFIMGVTGSKLKTPSTPHGILNIEFANTPTKAAKIINAWDNNLIQIAQNNTYWDFVFLLFYSFFFYNLCKWIYHLLPNNKYGKLGLQFAKLSILTGFLDIIENLYILKVLTKNYTNMDLTIMTTVSYIKWILVVAIILFCLIGFVYRLSKGKSKIDK